MHSNLTQWKRAGLITLKSLDRNQELLTCLLGWGSLLVAAGTSYYYARKSINERRAQQEARGQRPSEKLDWRERIDREEKKLDSGNAAAPSAATSTAVQARSAEKGPRRRLLAMSKGRSTIPGSRAPTTLNVASLELNENRAATSYPRTRSQTKAASPLLKRKISDNGTAKASRPAKVARTRSLQHAKAKSRLSTSAAVEDRLVDESNEYERTMWPVNVPRSMLFSFRVDSPSSQSHDSLAATARPEQPKERPDCSMFSASGPQAMFDHTWRVMFVEPRTAHRYGPPPLPQSTTSEVVATPIVPRRSLTESDVALPADRSSSAPSPATTVLAQHAPYAPGNCSISSPLYPVEISSQGSHPKGDAAFNAQPQAFPTLFPPLPPSLSTALVAPRRERTGVAEPPCLVIHLKWHWGASSLDWKRGISKRCKTIERAFLDAERRREEAAQRQLAHGFPDMPPSLAMLDTHAKQGRSESTLPLAANPSSISPDPSHSFVMPIVAQPSFDAFDFSLSSSANSSCASPSESYHSHVYPPATLASSSTTSMMYDSLPHTPDLLVDTGSSNGASTGRASPTWSDNLFGPEEDADADAEGEDDDGDLFGVCLPIATGTGANAAATVQGHSSTSTDATANWGPAVPSPTRSPALRLPPMFFDDEDSEADDEHESDAFSWDDNDDGDDGFFAVRQARRPHGYGADSADGLTPLSGLVSLHSLPELDVFGGLSIF
ncbi:hypothetical protein GY45DRAFT_1339801 [Cubamyces sp. BRFM 1775]|nr:hypothetical protein GY45DRAFT_1339801 [Cubamyces sp. BRFM 1775]